MAAVMVLSLSLLPLFNQNLVNPSAASFEALYLRNQSGHAVVGGLARANRLVSRILQEERNE